MKSATASSFYTLWYVRLWPVIYMATGILVSLIFGFGALILEDYINLLYMLLGAVLNVMGYNRLTKPYLEYSENFIRVRGGFGGILYTYSISKEDHVVVKNKRVFLNDEKLRFNHWFTRPHEYDKLLRFFSGSQMPADELQD
jgi:hypothetical protein